MQVPPGGMTKRRQETCARTISSRTSPAIKLSPSFFFHDAIPPSVIVGDMAGMANLETALRAAVMCIPAHSASQLPPMGIPRWHTHISCSSTSEGPPSRRAGGTAFWSSLKRSRTVSRAVRDAPASYSERLQLANPETRGQSCYVKRALPAQPRLHALWPWGGPPRCIPL